MSRYEEISKSYWVFNNSLKSYKGECEDFARNLLIEFQTYIGENDCIQVKSGDNAVLLSDRHGIAKSLFLDLETLDFTVTFRINYKHGYGCYKIGFKKVDEIFIVKLNPPNGPTFKLKTKEIDVAMKKFCSDFYDHIFEYNNNGFYSLVKNPESAIDNESLRRFFKI